MVQDFFYQQYHRHRKGNILIGKAARFQGCFFPMNPWKRHIGKVTCVCPSTNLRSLWGTKRHRHHHPCWFSNLKKKAMRKSHHTWRIIPVSKWSGTPIYKPFRPFGSGTTLLGGLINHGYQPLTSPGMILQVGAHVEEGILTPPRPL